MSTEELLARDPHLKNRPYQIEALQSIFQYEKCVVKMFCGTGKSRIMTNVMLHENKNLSVVVFPSLALIQQYSSDYLQTFTHQLLNISTEMLDSIVSTTDTVKIRTFLRRTEPKVILVTYQSLEVLLSCLDQKIPLIQYDEAHHTTGPECHKLVFETEHFEKQVFYTATPETKNGVLYDPDDEESIPLAFEYTYLEGLRDGVLNAFDVCVDMYTENTNQSVYEAIARAILSRGTSRGLLFHSGVNGEGNTSVWNFVDEKAFQVAFDKVSKEFTNHYTKITFVGMDGNTPTSERKRMLRELDETPMHEIYLISSCETIGEGVDTKRANLCVFVDPKTSTVKLIQNIGRVLRRNAEEPLSTILIPCWINMEHYAEAETREEKDALIREQMRATNGDYSPILNVLGALKQDDEELYNMCLHYPNRKHKEASLREQGFEIGEEEYSQEDVEEMRQTSKLEVHTDAEIRTQESVQKSEETTRLYDEEADVYRPDEDTVIEPPKPKVRMSIHQNDEIQMLWSVKEVDFTKQFCTVVIECEVSRNEENWYLKRDELCAYIDANGKTPPQKTQLGAWLTHQKINYKKQLQIMSDPEIRKCWEEILQKYPCLGDLVAQWYLKRDELCAYIDANGRVPSDRTSLGKWVCTKRKNYKKQEYIMADPEIRKSWEEMLEKYPCLTIDLVAQWYLKRDELCAYIDANGVPPDRTSSLGKNWVTNQKTNYRKQEKNMSIPEIRKSWEEMLQKYPCLTIDLVEKWYLKRDELSAYIDANGQVPPTRTQLGTWVNTQKQNYRKQEKNMSNPEIRKSWEEMLQKYPCLTIDLAAQWYLKRDELSAYIDANGQVPPQKIQLGHWFNTQKQNYKKQENNMANPEIRKSWEEMLEKYPCLLDLVAQWYLKRDELSAYIDSNGKVPPRKTQLGNWFHTQKQNYKKQENNMTNPEIRKSWEEMLEKYPCLLDLVEKWYLKRDELSAYIDANGQVPPQTIQLGTWVNTQKQNYKKQEQNMAEPEIRKLWEDTLQKYPCLATDLVAQWYLKRDELCEYIDTNGRVPLKITPLYSWLNSQKAKYRKQEQIMADPEIRKSWEEMLEKYPCLGDLIAQWYLNRAELCAYIDANGRVPSQKSSHIPLYTWLQRQKKNYKKQEQIMADPEIRKIWEDTVQKYPCLRDRPTKSMNLSITNAVTESPEQKRQRVHSELSQLHQKYKTLTSDHLREAFTENPSLWHTYHAISEENETSFPEQEIPRNRIIQELAKIKTKRTKLVVDMGCGKAHIARHFQDTRFKFINLDHVACDETVTACDISNTKLEEDSVEVCILSLAMWGSNCKDYLREAHRILESNGILYLIEPTKRWTDVEPSDKLHTLLEESGFRIVEKTIAKFSLFICSK
jgi:superfamily II DNA or RNA helicase